MKYYRMLIRSKLYDFFSDADNTKIPIVWQSLHQDSKKTVKLHETIGNLKAWGALAAVSLGFSANGFTFYRDGISIVSTLFFSISVLFLCVSLVWFVYHLWAFIIHLIKYHANEFTSQRTLETLNDIVQNSQFFRNLDKDKVSEIMGFVGSFHELLNQVHSEQEGNPHQTFDRLFAPVFMHHYPLYLKHKGDARSQAITALQALVTASPRLSSVAPVCHHANGIRKL